MVISRRFSTRRYRDRAHAGRVLAERLSSDLRGRDDTIVLALPRGGVDVAAPIAEDLRAPLDVYLVHKIGVPWEPEVAAGAIGADDAVVMNDDVLRATGLTPARLAEAVDAARTELRRRDAAYRDRRPQPVVAGRTVVLVDDGVATGATMNVAVRALRSRGAGRIVVAVPAGPVGTADMFPEADSVVCPYTPEDFIGVGGAYDDFAQLTDARVRSVLDQFTDR
ncbi:phosphoribosyltransferase [Gordonia sp. LUNF6]|uniref:phosphoribosyltransferase n=1 Tax=Gordonia TaxID=2053 RepID=UPI0009E45C21|nr:phosphoribosyltransferase family protein [Gordonia sihwensis]